MALHVAGQTSPKSRVIVPMCHLLCVREQTLPHPKHCTISGTTASTKPMRLSQECFLRVQQASNGAWAQQGPAAEQNTLEPTNCNLNPRQGQKSPITEGSEHMRVPATVPAGSEMVWQQYRGHGRGELRAFSEPADNEHLKSGPQTQKPKAAGAGVVST